MPMITDHAPIPLEAARGQYCHSDLGHALLLMRSSKLHRRWYVGDIDVFIIPPLKLGQVYFYYERVNKLVGMVSWARITPQLAEGMAFRLPELQPDQWQCGPLPWIMDFIAPYGHTAAMVDHLATEVFAQEEVHAIRRGANGAVRKIGRWTGRGWRESSVPRKNNRDTGAAAKLH